nr:transposase, MuDR, MULE transposase domain protein [Tanacetum cinerariifolium]
MSFKLDIPDTPVYKSKPMISKQYSQQSEVKKGQIFDYKEALVLAVRLKALNDGFQILVDRSAPKRCHLNAISLNNVIGSLGLDFGIIHSSITLHILMIFTRVPKLKHILTIKMQKKVITHLLTPKLQDRSGVLRGKDIQKDFLEEYQIHISYQQAWRRKDYGIKHIRGSPYEAFEMLPYYCYNLEQKNEVTVTRIKTDEKGVFEMLFIAIGASIRTFLNYLRHVLMIYAAHLKGLYKGTNLVVVAMDGNNQIVDGNNQIVPITFCICKGETGKGGLDDPKGVLYGSSRSPLYQVNLFRDPAQRKKDTVSLTVGADLMIGLRRENQDVIWRVMDSVQLETAVNTISHEYLLEFTSEYGISEMLHPELPGPKNRIVDFPEGKGIIRYTYPSWWMSFSKRPGKNTPQCYTKPLDSLKNWNNLFFWVDECVFPTAVEWRTNASKDGMPTNGTYSMEAVRVLDTHRTPIQKQPEMLLCLVEIDLFSLICAPNLIKVKTGCRPRAPHELLLLTLIAPRVIEMDEPAAATDSSGVPSAIERSPLDFAYEAEASGRETAALEMPPPEEVPITTAPGADQAAEAVVVEPPAVRESRKRGHEWIDANAPPKSLRRDHADLRPSCSSRGGKSLAAMQLCLASNIFMSEGVPADVSDPDPLAPGSENASSPAEVGSPGSVYRPEWGVTNGSLLDTPEACQDLVDHAAPPGYFTELRHMPNEEFLRQYNVNLARQVAMGSQLRLSGEEKLKATFEEFKRYEDDRVEQRCAELDARLDALSIDFDEELYPHMLMAIAG